MATWGDFKRDLRNRVGRASAIDGSMNDMIRSNVQWLERNFTLPYQQRVLSSAPGQDQAQINLQDDDAPHSITLIRNHRLKKLRGVYVGMPLRDPTGTLTDNIAWNQIEQESNEANFIPPPGGEGDTGDFVNGQYPGVQTKFWVDTGSQRDIRINFNKVIPTRLLRADDPQSAVFNVHFRVILDVYTAVSIGQDAPIPNVNIADRSGTHPILDFAYDVLMYRCVIDAATILRDPELQKTVSGMYGSALQALAHVLQGSHGPLGNIGMGNFGASADERFGLSQSPPIAIHRDLSRIDSYTIDYGVGAQGQGQPAMYSDPPNRTGPEPPIEGHG